LSRLVRNAEGAKEVTHIVGLAVAVTVTLGLITVTYALTLK